MYNCTADKRTQNMFQKIPKIKKHTKYKDKKAIVTKLKKYKDN